MDPSDAGLPHRPPFLFVREIIELDAGKRATATTEFSGREPFFEGHFPGMPLVPGVLLTEAMAQTAGIALAPPKGKILLLTAVRSMKFLRAVEPPAVLTLHATVLAWNAPLAQCQTEAFDSEGRPVAEGMLVFTLREAPESGH